MLQSWISTFIAIVTGIVTITITITYLRSRVETLQSERNEIKTHLEAASKELNAAVQAIAVFTREQTVINQFTTKSLESLVRRQEELEKRLNDQNATIQLLVQLVKRLEKTNVE